MLPQITGGLTANGNLKTQVHQNLKAQFGLKVQDALGVIETPNGDYAIALADADGKIVYARLEFAITTVDPMVEKPKSQRKTKVVEAIEVPII